MDLLSAPVDELFIRNWRGRLRLDNRVGDTWVDAISFGINNKLVELGTEFKIDMSFMHTCRFFSPDNA